MLSVGNGLTRVLWALQNGLADADYLRYKELVNRFVNIVTNVYHFWFIN